MSPRKKNEDEEIEAEDIFERPARKRVGASSASKSMRKPASAAKHVADGEPHRKTIVFQSMDASSRSTAQHSGNHHIALYRNIALGFFVVTMLLFAAIFFTSVRKATISIGYVPQKVNYTDVVHVARQRADGKTIAGVVELQKVSLVRTYTPVGRERKDVPIVGFVQLINEHTKDQPLVKTTRLLASNGKLYRLSKSVVVPAKGMLERVEMYADEPGAGSATDGPVSFTIPGLWEPLQKKIYGKSADAFTGGVLERGIVSAQDMQKAEADVRQALTAQAQEQLKTIRDAGGQGVFDGVMVSLDTLQIERNADIGATVGSFALTAKANAIIVRYRKEELEQFIRARLAKLPIEEYATLAYDPSQLTLRVESYDAGKGQAQLSVFESVTKALKSDASQFASAAFAGKSESEIQEVFKNLPGVESVQTDVSFFPYWVKTVPSVGGTVTVDLRQLPAPEQP